MKRMGGAVSFVLSFGLLAIACGGSSGGADPASVKAGLTSPTGTLEPAKSGDLANAAADQQEQSGSVGGAMGALGGLGGFGAMGGTVTAEGAKGLAIKTIRTLQTDGDDGDFGSGDIQCDASGASGSGSASEGSASISCKCASGSLNLEYKFKGMDKLATGPVTFDYTLKFGACKAGDVTIDGQARVQLDAPKGTQDETSMSMIFAAAFSYIKGTSAPENVKLAYGTIEGKMWYLVETAEGSFAVRAEPWDRATKTGTVYVKDKTGEHTCQVVNGTATCDGAAAGDAGL